MPLFEEVRDSVANTNFKLIAEYPATHHVQILEDGRIFSKQMNNDLIRGSARFNGALDAIMLRGCRDLVEVDPAEARSVATLDSRIDPLSQGAVSSNNLGQLMAVVSLAQQLAKVAQTTHPTSGYPGASGGV